MSERQRVDTETIHKVQPADRDEIAFPPIVPVQRVPPVIIDAGETRYWVRKIDLPFCCRMIPTSFW